MLWHLRLLRLRHQTNLRNLSFKESIFFYFIFLSFNMRLYKLKFTSESQTQWKLSETPITEPHFTFRKGLKSTIWTCAFVHRYSFNIKICHEQFFPTPQRILWYPSDSSNETKMKQFRSSAVKMSINYRSQKFRDRIFYLGGTVYQSEYFVDDLLQKY